MRLRNTVFAAFAFGCTTFLVWSAHAAEAPVTPLKLVRHVFRHPIRRMSRACI